MRMWWWNKKGLKCFGCFIWLVIRLAGWLVDWMAGRCEHWDNIPCIELIFHKNSVHILCVCTQNFLWTKRVVVGIIIIAIPSLLSCARGYHWKWKRVLFSLEPTKQRFMFNQFSGSGWEQTDIINEPFCQGRWVEAWHAMVNEYSI